MHANTPYINELAPSGTLRAALNMGNPVLAHYTGQPQQPAGVSVDLSAEFAKSLGVAVTFLCFPTAADSVHAVQNGDADIGFMAIDPKRSEGIHFSAPYVQIEGSYVVPNDSPITSNEQVDQAGHRLVVGAASAYDLFLTRHIRHAELVRVPLSEQVIETLLQSGYSAGAGVRQQLEAEAARVGRVRLLDGGFMVINQACAISAKHSHPTQQFLNAFVESMKASGFVARALSRHGIQGVKVAPLVS